MENNQKRLISHLEKALDIFTTTPIARKHMKLAMKKTVEIVVQTIAEPLENKQNALNNLHDILSQIRSIHNTKQTKDIRSSMIIIKEMLKTAINQTEQEIEENKNTTMFKKNPQALEILLLIKNRQAPIREIQKTIAAKYNISEDEVYKNMIILDIAKIIEIPGDILNQENTTPQLTQRGEDLFRDTNFPSA